jgi:cell division protein FtsL
MATATARAQTRRAEPQRRARPAAQPERRPRPVARPRLAGSVLWIGVVAALLAGIVALNVAVLRLNMESERLEERKGKLTEQGDALAAELSSAAAAGRIEAIAVGKLGLERPAETTYLRLLRAKR